VNEQNQTFDPESFMNTSQGGEAFETEYQPIPEGEYPARISKLVSRVTQSGSPLLDVTWQMDAPGNEDADQKWARQTYPAGPIPGCSGPER
jgi:hypothetical protein